MENSRHAQDMDMPDARHAQEMDMSDARHAQAHLRQAGRVHVQHPHMQRYFSPNGGYYTPLQQEPNTGHGMDMNGVNGGMGPRRSVGGGIDVDALAAGVQRFLPGSNSGPPIASSSASSRPPSLSSSLSHPSLTSLHPHSRHSHHPRPPHMSLSSTPHTPSSSSVSPGAYIALPHGMDPSTVDFRTFYPYNPSEVKHRKRTTRGQLKILEETFRRETKPNAVMRKALAAELEMTPRGVQVWFQNRRAKEKAIQKKASQGGDKKPNVRLGKDNDDNAKDPDELTAQEDGEGDDLDGDLDCEDIDLDGDEKPDIDEASPETKAKPDSKSNSSDGSSSGSDTLTSNGAGPSGSPSPPPSGVHNSNSSSDDARPRMPLAVEIPQPPPVGVRVSPPTTTEDKSDGSPRRLSPSGTNVSRMSWSQGSSYSDDSQQQQHPSSAVLPPSRTTPTPNVPSLEDETLLSLRRPSLPTHLHGYGQNSVSNVPGSGGPPNAFRMSGPNARSARGLGSFSGVSSAGFQNGLSPLALNGIDPMQRRMSLDRLSRHPYAHLAAQANGMVFGARYRPSSALGGGSSNRLPIGPKTGLHAPNQSPNAMQTSSNAGLQTIGSVGNTPMHTPQPRQSELPHGTGDAPGMDTELAPDQGVSPQMQQQMQTAQQQQQQQQQQYLHITRPELMHRASLPAQSAIQFRNPFDSIGASNANGDGSDGNGSGTGDNAMQGIQTSTNFGVPRGPLSASAIHSPPMFSSPFASSQHSLHSQPQHSATGPFSDSGTYPATSAQMRFPREGHSYVLSTRSYQPPLAGPLPNPDFQFGTGTSPSSGESDGSGSSGSPDPAAGSSGGDTDQGLNHQLQSYSFPSPDGGVSDANSNAVDASAGSGDVYEMRDLNVGMAPSPFHPYMTSRYNSVVSVADSEVSVASHYSNAPSEVGSYDVGPHGHVQHAAHLQGFDDGRRPSYTGQMMEQFSNLGMHNGSNLSLAQQHASQQQQRQLEAVAEQNSPMSNGHASPESSVAVAYSSPSMSVGSNEAQQQQNQNQGPIISQSSELAYALQPTDNSRPHPNSSVADVAGDLSVTQHGGEIRTRPDSIDASSLATSHRTSSDMSSMIYPLSASAASSSSSLGFQPPHIHHSSDFRKPQPQLDMDFYHPPYDDVSETGHYSPISQPTSMSFDVPPSLQLNYASSVYESHGSHMAQSHSMPPPQQQYTHLMGHGNNSYGQMQQHHHSQESLAFGVQSNNLGVEHSSDSFPFYN